MTKQELLKKIKDIEVTYDYEQTYCDLRNACIDYMNDAQDWDLDCLFEDWYDYSTIEDIAKNIIDNDGLLRLYYFLNDANLNNDLFKINTYGNLEDVHKDDLDYLKEYIIEELESE